MSTSIVDLRNTISSARDLHAVVRTMKALAASSIVQYEQAVRALDDYYTTVKLGLGVCIGSAGGTIAVDGRGRGAVGMVVFGSDQGLVGRFNDVVAEHCRARFGAEHDRKIWAVGERVREALIDVRLPVAGLLSVPTSVNAIVPLVGQILGEYEAGLDRGEVRELHLVFNKPSVGEVYAPVTEKLLPLEDTWRQEMSQFHWPTKLLPEVIGEVSTTLGGFVREFLFVSLFRACAASLASENASRLAAMRRADKNIDALLDDLGARFHRLRQDEIDEELFDVVAGYEALIQ